MKGASTGGKAGVWGGSLVSGGVRRKAAGKTRKTEVYQCEIIFLLFV